MSHNEELDFSTEYSGLDFYNIDAHLSDDERTYRDFTRSWVEDRFLKLDPTTGVSVIESHCRTKIK